MIHICPKCGTGLITSFNHFWLIQYCPKCDYSIKRERIEKTAEWEK